MPLVGFTPLHAPPAEQPVAFVDDQVRVVELPRITVDDARVSVTVGPEAFTATVAAPFADPPSPVHVNVYAVPPAPVGVTLSLPLVGFAPVQAPLAVQAVAFVDDHVISDDAPGDTDPGFAEIATAGAGGGAGGVGADAEADAEPDAGSLPPLSHPESAANTPSAVMNARRFITVCM